MENSVVKFIFVPITKNRTLKLSLQDVRPGSSTLGELSGIGSGPGVHHRLPLLLLGLSLAVLSQSHWRGGWPPLGAAGQHTRS